MGGIQGVKVNTFEVITHTITSKKKHHSFCLHYCHHRYLLRSTRLRKYKKKQREKVTYHGRRAEGEEEEYKERGMKSRQLDQPLLPLPPFSHQPRFRVFTRKCARLRNVHCSQNLSLATSQFLLLLHSRR